MQITVRGKKYDLRLRPAVAKTNRGKRIIGIWPEEPYSTELMQEIIDAYSSNISRRRVKTWKVPSSSRPGLVYTVRRIDDEYFCSCPAYSECWHIKYVKRQETGSLRKVTI